MIATSCSSQGRKRNKTCTGCWTCRSRKVKCDEARPVCSQCHSKQLECEGYGVRLRWMPLERGPFLSSNVPLLSRQRPIKSQRSYIAFDSRQRVLQFSEIDEILGVIDASVSAEKHSSRGSPLLVHNFGVFDAAPSDPNVSLDDAESVDATEPSTGTITEAWATSEHGTHLIIGAPLPCAPLNSSCHPLQCPDYGSLTSHDTGSVSDPRLPPHLPLRALDELPDASDDVCRNDCYQQKDVSHPGPPPFRWITASGAIVRNPSPVYMSKLERFLMHHYIERVVHLFCVIDNGKSPWKTIHLPRALQSTGQLGVQGSTSTIRDALGNALLSISAFYLSNDSKSRLCEDEAVWWANGATMFRGKAIKLLKDAVEGDLTSKSPPKYKELLATMLSMISINVMSGDTSTCNIHLDGAFRFMSHARKWKSKYSPKARSLHRIYFYLRTIHESTAVRKSDKDPVLAEVPEVEVQQPSPVALADVMRLVDDIPNPPALSHVTASGTRMGTYECIYGVPQSLLILLAKATDLINQVMVARECAGTADIPDDLVSKCDELETEIIDWTMEFEPKECLIEGNRTSSEIIRRTTSAFHNALIIYFAQHIRLIRHGYLQLHVQVVLDSIEAIEKIKAETHILAAPSFWPAFIAASEAFDKELQERFRKWYTQMEFYGIASIRTGIRVLTEVWKDGPGPANRHMSQWATVVKRTGSVLMLS